jgi:hypothetical protein
VEHSSGSPKARNGNKKPGTETKQWQPRELYEDTSSVMKVGVHATDGNHALWIPVND